MDCCRLSATSLKNIDTKEITSDNIPLSSSYNVGGFLNFNGVIVHYHAILSSLNVGRSTI